MPPKSSRQVPKISDVAALAGVSIATVSRAIAQPELVTEKTRGRVMQAVRKTGYTPNMAARTLRGGAGNLVLVVVPNLITQFFGELLQEIDRAMSPYHYGLLVGNLDDSADRAQKLAGLAHGGQVVGALLLNGRIVRGDSGAIGDGSIPAVAVSRPFESDIPTIQIDEQAAIELLIQHLDDLGHRDFAYVSGDTQNPVDAERWQALQSQIQQRGYSKPLRFEGDFHIKTGIQAGQSFLALAKRPTAVICSSDEMAMGFTAILREQGIDLPGEVSVTGFDGLQMTQFAEPRLTTIVQPQAEIAKAAVSALIALIEGQTDAQSKRITGHLQIGNSTGPPRSQR